MEITEKKDLDKAVKIIKTKLFATLIYATEDEHGLCFICMMDGNIMLKDIYSLKQRIKNTINKNVDIVDIFDIPLSERIELINHADPLYSGSDATREILEAAINDEGRLNNFMKTQIIDRKKTCRTSYLS